jgi:hypothetical protein
MALADVPENMQTHLAGTFLSGSAKTWFINTYADATPMPALDEVLKAFKEQHLAADIDVDLIRRIETMCQGRRSVSEYATEYKMLVLELGENVDPRWTNIHFLRGLDPSVHITLAPQPDGNEVPDKLVIRASNVACAIEQARPRDRLQAMQSPPTIHTMSRRTPASNNPGNANTHKS